MSSMFKKIALIATLIGSAASASAADASTPFSIDLSSGQIFTLTNGGTLTFSSLMLDALGTSTVADQSSSLLPGLWTSVGTDFGLVTTEPNIPLSFTSLIGNGSLTFSQELLDSMSVVGIGGGATPQIPNDTLFNPITGFPALWVSDGATITPIDLTNLGLTLNINPADVTQAVPEPANVAMFALGLLGMGAVARRHRRQAR